MRWGAVVVVLVVAVACGGAASPSAQPSSLPLATATASASPTAAPTASAAPGAARVRAEVISVTDGDTIRVRIDGQSVPIRYIGIDTPETVDPRRDVQCFGREASAFNAKLVAGKVVELEKDVSETDRFQRLLRYVYVDGKMVNEELVRGGFAISSSYPPDVKYQDRLRALEVEARTKGVGLWAANVCGRDECSDDRPDDRSNGESGAGRRADTCADGAAENDRAEVELRRGLSDRLHPAAAA